jgi:predicted dehydrogenase
MKTVRWGIIGCGDVTEKKSGPAFQKVEGSALTAVMRRDRDKAADYARRHGVPRWYTDADDLIADSEVDAVYVATPPSSHRDYTVRALEAGKPVYVEKPMAASLAQAEEMHQASRSFQLPLFVAYYRRSLPRFLKVKELVDTGRIGEVRMVRSTLVKPPSTEDIGTSSKGAGDRLPWRVQPEIAGGGYFFDLGSHTLDYFDYLLGPIDNVHGIAANQSGYYSAEDTLSAVWQFGCKAVGSGIWCFDAAQNIDENVIIGTEGSIRFSTFGTENVELYSLGKTEYFDLAQPEHVQQPLIETVVRDLQRFLSHGSSGRPAMNEPGVCPSTGESALRTARVMEKIVESYYQNRHSTEK